MTTTLAISSTQTFWDEKQLAALTQLGLTGAPKADLAVFFHQAQRTGLDPFARQIYMISRGGKFTIQASIDGLRIVAQRSGKYAGQTQTEWCGEDGIWRDVWLSKEFPLAARVGVHHADFNEPLYAIAKWDSYSVPNNPIWKKMPDLMLAKCAESLALRKAFPNDLSGIYTAEEMEQAEAPVKVKAVKTVAAIDTDAILRTIQEATSEEKLREIWKANSDRLDDLVSTTGKPVTIREAIIEQIDFIKLEAQDA